MERRLVIFFILAFGIMLGYSWLMQKLHPPRPRVEQLAANQAVEKAKPADKQKTPKEQPKAAEKSAAEKSADGKAAAEKPAAEKTGAKPKAPPAIVAAQPEAPEQWVSIGSASDTDPYRMLVTLASRGAAVARIELSSPRYCDIDDRSGYLGHLVMNSAANGNG